MVVWGSLAIAGSLVVLRRWEKRPRAPSWCYPTYTEDFFAAKKALVVFPFALAIGPPIALSLGFIFIWRREAAEETLSEALG